MSASFALTILVPYLLSAEEAGRVFLALAVAAFLPSVGEFGLTRILTREIALAFSTGREGDAQSWKSAAVMWSVFMGVLVAVGTWAVVDIGIPVLAGSGVWVGLLAGAITVLNLLSGALRGADRPGSAAFLANGTIPWILLISLGFQFSIDDRSSVGFLCLGGSIAVAVAVIAIVAGGFIAGIGSGVRPSVGMFRNQMLPSWLVSMTSVGMGQVDVILSGWLLGPEDIAQYALASRITAFLGLGLVFFNQSTAAQIVDCHAREQRVTLERILRTGSFWSSLFAGVGMIFGLLIFWVADGNGWHLVPAGFFLIFTILGIRQMASVLIGSSFNVLYLCWDQWKLARWSILLLVVWVMCVGCGAIIGGVIGIACGSCLGFIIYKWSMSLIAARVLGVRSGIIAPQIRHLQGRVS